MGDMKLAIDQDMKIHALNELVFKLPLAGVAECMDILGRKIPGVQGRVVEEDAYPGEFVDKIMEVLKKYNII